MSELTARAKRLAFFIRTLFMDQKLSGGQLVRARRGARHLSLAIRLTNSTDLEKALRLAEALALATNTKHVLAQRQSGLVVYQFELGPHFWQSYTRKDLPTSEAIGLAERRQPVNFTFQQPHTLVAGTTGSGKTETIKSILFSLMTSYLADQLNIIVCDPHNDLADFNNVAHLAMPIAINHDEQNQALHFTNQHLIHRKANNIREDRILALVLDEASDTLTDEASLGIVKSIAQEGRKFRVHVIVGTQKPSHKDLPNILDLLLNRFVGLVSDARVSANLTGRAGLQAHLLTGSGDFIHVAGTDVIRFQVAMATKTDLDRLERTEVKSVQVETTDLVELPTLLPERKPPGRPRLQLNPDWLAFYYYHGPDRISRRMAEELGLSRDFHDLHRDFCKRFSGTYLKLRRSHQKITGA
jgi:hypothetical protein